MRNYGLGDYTQYIVGRPRLVRTVREIEGVKVECPNCRIEVMAEIETVLRDMPLMRTEYSIGHYLSCPACPWASPMIVITTPNLPDWLTL